MIISTYFIIQSENILNLKTAGMAWATFKPTRKISQTWTYTIEAWKWKIYIFMYSLLFCTFYYQISIKIDKKYKKDI